MRILLAFFLPSFLGPPFFLGGGRVASIVLLTCLFSILVPLGNRHTDEISYRAVRIADDRIFTIDPKGNVKIGAGETSSKVVKATAAAAGGSAASVASSYPQLQKFCDLYFPPVVNDDASAKPIVEARDFSAVNYWGSGSFVPEGFDIDAALAN